MAPAAEVLMVAVDTLQAATSSLFHGLQRAAQQMLVQLRQKRSRILQKNVVKVLEVDNA